MELDALLRDDSSLAPIIVQEKQQCDQELKDIEVHIVILSVILRYHALSVGTQGIYSEGDDSSR